MSQFSLEHIFYLLSLKKKEGGYVYLLCPAGGNSCLLLFLPEEPSWRKQNVNMVGEKAHLFLQEINM